MVNIPGGHLVSVVLFIVAALGYAQQVPEWTLLQTRDTMTLYFKEVPVGTMYNALIVQSQQKRIVASNRVVLNTDDPALGQFNEMTLEESRIYDFGGLMIDARQSLTSVTGKSTWRCVKTKSGVWSCTTTVAGRATVQTIPHVAGNLRMQYALYSAVRSGRVTPRQQWLDTTFEFLSLQNAPMRVICVSLPKQLAASTAADAMYSFVTTDIASNTEYHWSLTAEGKIASQEVPPFFTAKRQRSTTATPADSKERLSLQQIADLFRIPDSHGPENGSLVLTFRPPARLDATVLVHYTHTQSDGRYQLNPMPVVCRETVGKRRVAPESWLRQTILLQTSDPGIRNLAQTVLSAEKETCAAIQAATKRIYTTIEKKNVATFSNAAETLKSGKGDCGEHAMLLAAVLRAMEIPAMPTIGLVYVEERKGYYYHAWVSVMADTLLFADPALGVFPASKGYIPLLYDDDGSNLVALAGLIDKITIDYRPDGGQY